MTDDLFAGETTPEPSDLLGDLDIRVEQFLNRWHWRGNREVVAHELRELLAFAKGEIDCAEVCRNAGCQEIR